MKKVIISVVTIQIILIAALLIHYSNKVGFSDLESRPATEVIAYRMSGASAGISDDGQKWIAHHFTIANHRDSDYDFNIDSLYLQKNEDKISGSDMEEENVAIKKLASQTIKPKSQIYGYLLYIIPLDAESEDYEIYFDDGNESYVVPRAN